MAYEGMDLYRFRELVISTPISYIKSAAMKSMIDPIPRVDAGRDSLQTLPGYMGGASAQMRKARRNPSDFYGLSI